MSLGHSANIVKDGLVFAYDIGSQQSWKGKPTTNIIADAGLDCALERSGTSYPFVSRNITSQVQAAWSSSNPTFSMSFEGYRDAVAGGRGGGNDGYPVMYIYFTDWSWATTINRSSYNWSYTGKTFNMPDPTGKTIYFACYHMNSGNRGRSYGRNFQITHDTFVPPFVNGTRSNTESIIDWAGDSIITNNSLIYNSDNTFSFDGTTQDNYCTITPSAALSAIRGTSNITVESWVYYTSYSGGSESYSVVTVWGNPWAWLVENPSNRLRFRIHAGGSDVSVSDSATHPLNTWLHVVGTYDGSNMKIYVNGKLKATRAQTGTLGSPGGTPKIGTFQGSNYCMSGKIDSVKIYNRTLDAQEVKQNFNALRSRYSI